MARIKLNVPEYFIFQTYIPIRITDLNYGAHTSNDAVLGIAHEARLQFLNSLGFSELDLGGTSLIMADAGIEYVNESFYGDKLRIKIAVDDMKRVSFDLYFLFETERDGLFVTVARLKTGMVCYDYAQKKVTAIPEKVVEAFKKAVI